MAVLFRLANETQSLAYSFMTDTIKYKDLTRTSNGDGWQTTSLTVVGRAADADIITGINYIDDLAARCDLFWGDVHRIESIWLEEQATAETSKRSLVRSIKILPIQTGNLGPTLGKTGAIYTVVIIHLEMWEKVANEGITAPSTVNSLAGMVTLAAIDGSIDGRIKQLLLDGSAASTGHMTTIWGGIKPVYTALTDFNPIFEMENGNLAGGAALANGGANASPTGAANNIVTYTTTAADVKIIYETLDDAYASTNYNHWEGDYLLLLRCKISAANAVKIHVDWGYKYGSVFNRGPDQYITNTDYMLIEMGSISIPPLPRYDSTDGLRYFELQLYVQHMVSAVTFTADCILLIPSYYSFKISNADLENNGSSEIYAFQSEDDLASCYNVSAAGVVNMAAQYSPNNFVYPIYGGKLVLAGQEATIQNLADIFDLVNILYKERYRTHGE